MAEHFMLANAWPWLHADPCDCEIGEDHDQGASMTDTDLWAEQEREWREEAIEHLNLTTGCPPREADLYVRTLTLLDRFAAARAEVADLRDGLARVQAVLADSCHHCGRLPDEDGDHTCTCPVTDSECLEHTAEPVVSLSAVLAALGDADTLAERCPVSDAALGRCVLDAHDGDVHAWEGVAGPPGAPQRWQSGDDRADRVDQGGGT